MRRRFIQILVLSLCAAPWTAVAAAGAAQAALPDFRLLDTTGRAHTIHRYVDASAIVIMAIAPGDPALEAKLTAFAELAASHKDTNVFCFLLAPAPLAAPIAGPAAGIPVLVDDAQIVLPALGLTHAFQCVMAEPVHWGVFYRGDLSGGAAALTAFQSGAPQPAAAPVSGAMLALDPVPQAVSYTKDIVPILSSRCVACHSEGNIAPFSMDSHRKVAGRAAMIAETVRAARMPPWNADPKFGHFSNAMGLSTIEKRTLLAWIDAGAPKDGDADPLTEIKVARPTGWRLGQPDMVVKLPEPQQIPADGTLEYKYYEVPLDLPEGTWLRGTEVRISQPEVMHHVLVYMRHAGEEIDFTQEYIASYVPGHDPGFFPEGTGKPVPANATLLFQLHYTPNGRAVTDSPELGIYLCKEKPQHEVFLGSAVNRDITIPPFAVEAEASATFRAPSDILVYSLAPHMHYRGRRMSFEAIYPSGEKEMLLSVPDYDFYWQHSYHLAEPKRLPRGAIVRVAGAYDNSRRNPLNPDPGQALRWGDQSTDEMFLGSVLYRNAD